MRIKKNLTKKEIKAMKAGEMKLYISLLRIAGDITPKHLVCSKFKGFIPTSTFYRVKNSLIRKEILIDEQRTKKEVVSV